MRTKTSVYLDVDEKRQLEELAVRSHTSEADLVRRGVRMVLDAARPAPTLGIGASTDGRSARDTDALLDATGFGVD